MDLFQENGLILIPAGNKPGMIHSIRPGNGDGDLVFTNDTVRTRVTPQGLLEMIPAGTPRLDVASGKPVLLMEPARNNLCLYPTHIHYGNPGYYQFNGLKGSFDQGNTGPNLITGGNFDIPEHWSVESGLKIENGVCSGLGEVEVSSISQLLPESTNGNKYAVHITLSNLMQGVVYAVIGEVYSKLLDIEGPQVLEIAANGSISDILRIEASEYFIGDIDNVSVVRVSGFDDPFGAKEAIKIIEGTTTTSHHTKISNINILTNTKYTASCFFKKGERNLVFIRLADTTSAAFFDLDSGQCVHPGTGNFVTKIELVGGYWRCSVTRTITSSLLNIFFGMATVAGSISYLGNGTSGIYMYGVQIEQGMYPTSFIFDGTNGLLKTRALDSATVTDLLTKGITSPQAWTAYLDIHSFSTDTIDKAILDFYDASQIGALAIVVMPSGYLVCYDETNHVLPWGANSGLSTGGKICITYDGTLKMYVNGIKNPVNYIPDTAILPIRSVNIVGRVACRINAFILMPRCFTDAEAIELTG